MKVCNRCKIEKECALFHSDKSKSDGLATLCKKCKKIQKSEYKKTDRYRELLSESSKRHYQKHRDRLLKYRKDYYSKNKEDWTRRFKDDYYKNKEKYRQKFKRDYEKFSHRHVAKVAAYRSRKLNATPSYANLDAIKAIYLLAKNLTEATGIIHEVDHIIPLQGETVCGLHHEKNLRVITRYENRKKRNKLLPQEILQKFTHSN